jgi:hypothetical protein
MLEVGLGVLMFFIVLGILGLIVWNGRREEQKQESVKRSQGVQQPEQARPPSTQTPRYVESTPRDTDTASIPAVSDTGIGTDTARLAGSLTEAQMLEVLALARTSKGKWAYSGRKLYTLFGGNYNDFCATMRRLRDDQDDDSPEEPAVLTPVAGRPTKASYYPDDPDLAYHPPPD